MAIIVALSAVIGIPIAVDSFYVRSAAYKEDREASAKQLLSNSLSQEVVSLETREAFTRYRLSDAVSKTKLSPQDNVNIEGYRRDLNSLEREIASKKRLMDDLRAGKDK